MKYLQDYMTERQNVLIEKTGTFFAFGEKQLIEKIGEGKTKDDYISMGMGMITLKENADELAKGLRKIYKESIIQDIEENGIVRIIRRELNNHEAFYIKDLTDTIDKLKDYDGITKEDIIKVFRRKNITNEELKHFMNKREIKCTRCNEPNQEDLLTINGECDTCKDK